MSAELLQDLEAVYNAMHDKRGQVADFDDVWSAIDWCMGELRPVIQHHKIERNRQLAESVKKSVFWAVFADYSDYPSAGMDGCVCLTADWRAAYYAYNALIESQVDKDVSLWQLEEGKWERVNMENQI